MRVERRDPRTYAVELDDDAELDRLARVHLAVGGLYLRPADPLPPFTEVAIELGVAGRPAVPVRARVVGNPPGALALQLEGDPQTLIAALRAVPSAAPEPPVEEPEVEAGTLWERLRELTPPQKILLAPKADRLTRALLVQESDPQVLFALLKNPRLTLDEVVRVAKSSFLSFQAAELILKTSQWIANLDIRLALVHNPKTPVPFALRILATLPDVEVRAIAKGAATSQALRQAALRRIVGG